MRHLIRKSELIAWAFFSLSSFAASVQADVFHWCYVDERDYGRYVYYSTVFRVKDFTYAVGIQNSFGSHIDARFNPRNSDTAHCMGPYDSYSEAVDELNDDIAGRRRGGKSVTLTHWAYQGD